MVEINRIIQVSHSNTLHRAENLDDMKKELRDHVVKLNDALRRLSTLVQRTPSSGGTYYDSSPSGGGGGSTTTITQVVSADISYARHFLFLGA